MGATKAIWLPVRIRDYGITASLVKMVNWRTRYSLEFPPLADYPTSHACPARTRDTTLPLWVGSALSRRLLAVERVVLIIFVHQRQAPHLILALPTDLAPDSGPVASDKVPAVLIPSTYSLCTCIRLI